VRASRLIQLLLLLQTRGRATAAVLAEELEVSTRTIYRDVEALGAAGVPVYAESGPGGGISLVEGYRTRLTGLTEAEAAALALQGLPGASAAELGLGTVLAAAQLKVDASLPPELRARASRVRDRFHVDAPGWFGVDEDVRHLPTVAQAVWDGRRLALRYRRAGSEVRRTVDPLGLVLKAGRWYLLALAGRARQVRTYRVARIAGARVLDAPGHRPEGFDLSATWAQAQAGFAQDILRIEVRARVRAAAAGRLHHCTDRAAATRALASMGEPDAGGWADITIPSEGVAVAEVELLRMGADLEVLDPPELRSRLAAHAAGLAALYVGG
jgi:predicted DNA-binding transcriptional regulator YafY